MHKRPGEIIDETFRVLERVGGGATGVVRGDSRPYSAVRCATAVDPTGLSIHGGNQAWMQERRRAVRSKGDGRGSS